MLWKKVKKELTEIWPLFANCGCLLRHAS